VSIHAVRKRLFKAGYIAVSDAMDCAEAVRKGGAAELLDLIEFERVATYEYRGVGAPRLLLEAWANRRRLDRVSSRLSVATFDGRNTWLSDPLVVMLVGDLMHWFPPKTVAAPEPMPKAATPRKRFSEAEVTDFFKCTFPSGGPTNAEAEKAVRGEYGDTVPRSFIRKLAAEGRDRRPGRPRKNNTPE
jgi:hypothetical protein